MRSDAQAVRTWVSFQKSQRPDRANQYGPGLPAFNPGEKVEIDLGMDDI